MAFEFNVHAHTVFQPAIIPPSPNPPAPSDAIIVQLTIQFSLVFFRHLCLQNIYLYQRHFRSRQISFDFNLLGNEALLRQTLDGQFHTLHINTGSVNYQNLIREIMGRGHGLSDRVLNRGDGYKVLPLRSKVVAYSLEHDHGDWGSMTAVLEESEEEFERRNYGMVPAKESSVVAMLKKVTIEDEEEEKDCMVCLDTIKVGTDANQMPCSHVYHGHCIQEWLKWSHYCPICRYEMPTDDEIKI